jgi:hypothetical protein
MPPPSFSFFNKSQYHNDDRNNFRIVFKLNSNFVIKISYSIYILRKGYNSNPNKSAKLDSVQIQASWSSGKMGKIL